MNRTENADRLDIEPPPGAAARVADAPTGARAGRFVPIATALLLTLLWSFVAYWAASSRQETIASSEQILRRMSHAVEEQTRGVFKLVEIALGLTDQWVFDHPGADARGERRLSRMVEGFGSRGNGAFGLYLADEYGVTAPLGDSPQLIKPFGEAGFFRAALTSDAGRFFIGPPLAAGSPGVWKIPVAQRLTKPLGAKVALVALIDVATLMAFYEEERLRPGGAILLVQRDGTLLARAPYDERLLGKSIVGGQLYREFLPRGESGFVRLDRTVIDGIEKYASYSTMADFPLLIVASAPADQVLDAWRRQALIVSLLAAAISVAMVYAARRLSVMLHALSARTAELEHLATTDVLTGVHNRHSFMHALYYEFARARRYRTSLALMVFDLDFFKQINDGYGHAAGDEALRAFADAAGACLRDVDVLGRLGGEEFGILLPNTGIDQAEAVAERIRGEVARIAIDTEYGTVRYTTSVGVTQDDESDESIDALLARADAALYAAKAAGRNRVMVRAA